MSDEFTPNASVDFEALAAAAAAEAVNGDGAHFNSPTDADPPPARPRGGSGNRKPSDPLDPFQALENLTRDQGLMFRELGDINARLGTLQIQTALMFGSALLLAVLVWKFSRPAPARG